MGNNAAAIAVDGSTLRVAEGQSITLVGGNTGFTDTTGSIVSGGVSITNGSLIAPGGTINIVSVGKSSNPGVGGQVPLNPTEPITGFANMGDVAIVRNVGDFAQLTTTGNSGGGKIVIRGGQIEVQNYRIVADAGDNTLGEVAIQGKNVSITNRPDIPCFGCGAGEGIRIGANRGTLTITGTDSVALDGALIGGAIDPFSVFPTGPVTISAPTVSVSDTSFRIGGNALMRGRLDILGENVTIISSSMLKGENFSPVDVNILAQNLAYINGFNMPLLATGDRVGSSVSIQARDIQMIGTRIDTQHLFMDGLGDAGPITIAGRRNVTIMDSEFTSNTAAVPRAGTPGVSDGGTIAITAGKDLEVSNSMIAAETRWAGHGGNILLGAGTNVTVENSTLSVKSNMTGTDTFHGIGPAGNIAIGAGKNVSVKNSTLSANSQGMAEAGVIGIGAGKNITVNQSTVTAEGLGGGGDGHIVFGAGHNISLKGSTVTPAPVIFEGLD